MDWPLVHWAELREGSMDWVVGFNAGPWSAVSAQVKNTHTHTQEQLWRTGLIYWHGREYLCPWGDEQGLLGKVSVAKDLGIGR